MNSVAALIASAFLLDWLTGDPAYPLHPVRLIGLLIRALERTIAALRLSGALGGLVLLVSATLLSAGAYLFTRHLISGFGYWAAPALDIYTAYSCIALRDMVNHARPIALAIEKKDIARARQMVQRIVGRDASLLGLPQIASATVESIGESFVDGFLAPVFWAAAGGVAGLYIGAPLPSAVTAIILYRCVNTLDSMVGYRSEKYLRLGMFSARADDILNFIPARLSIPLFVPAAVICGLSAHDGWRIAWRDRLKHASPNSAHAESFLAGALGLRLGGPTVYPHGTVDKPWIGDGNEDADSAHIFKACRLVMSAGALTVIALLAAGSLKP